MYQLRDQIITNQELVFGEDALNYLGPGLTMKNCVVSFRTTQSALIMSDVTFVDCEIKIAKPLKNFGWFNASLEKCTFHGELIGCDFGHWPEIYGENGRIHDCDFTGSILDSCRFIDVEVSSLLIRT